MFHKMSRRTIWYNNAEQKSFIFIFFLNWYNFQVKSITPHQGAGLVENKFDYVLCSFTKEDPALK